jgi:hypothetical protein
MVDVGVATSDLLFVLLRWLWRYLVWWWFLGRCCAPQAVLTGAHPDAMGGSASLHFISRSSASSRSRWRADYRPWQPNRILHGLARSGLPDRDSSASRRLHYVWRAPLLVFTPRLVMAKAS